MSLLHLPRAFHPNSAGSPYALAKLYVYEETTTTEVDLYSERTLGTPLTNPVVADANGIFPAIYIDSSVSPYIRVQLKTSADVLIYDEDQIPIVETELTSSSVTGSLTVSGAVTVGDISPEIGTGKIYGKKFRANDTEPNYQLYESDQGTNKKLWDLISTGGAFYLRTRTDADGNGRNAFVVTRGTSTDLSQIDIGNATDTPIVTLNGVTLVAASIVQQTTGSFTGTLTGMAGATTLTIYYKIHNGIVSLSSNGVFGTSNTTAMTMTGLPASLRMGGAASSSVVVPCVLIDNGTEGLGWATIASNDTVTFGFATRTGAFTNSGNKGLDVGFCITYPL